MTILNKDFLDALEKRIEAKTLLGEILIDDEEEQPGPSQSRVEPGPSQTGDFEPVKSENQNWQCPCCSYSNKRRDVVDRHIKEVHLGENIHSRIFFNFFQNLYFLITGIKNFVCFCGKAFGKNKYLQKHMKVHERKHERKEDYKCEPGPSQTGDFEPTRLENGNWQCPCCSLSHKRRGVVNKHIKEVHLGILVTIYILLCIYY